VSSAYELPEPIRVTVGTVGPPGQRVFFLQARDERILITVKLEKRQVEALARHLGQLLQDLPRPGHLPDDVELDLEAFAEPNFVAGALAVAYDADADRLILIAEELVGEDEDGDQVRLVVTREQAGALAIRGTRLVESGRPPCPLCGFPLDPRGHACPRTNGHHAPLT
jgi:uncharacterized repeat protein (TIGR03847 family)